MVNHKVEIENLGITLLHFWSGAMGAIEGSNVIYSEFPQKTELHGEEERIKLLFGSFMIFLNLLIFLC